MGLAYQLKALELANLTIPLLNCFAHRGCAGSGRQGHLLKFKGSKIERLEFLDVSSKGPPLLHGPYVRLFVHSFLPPSVLLTVCPSVRPSVCPSVRHDVIKDYYYGFSAIKFRR